MPAAGKRIAILGSTGSIGTTALRVIDGLNAQLDGKEQPFEVVALSGHSNIKLLAEQIRRYRPRLAVVSDEGCLTQFRSLTEGLDVEVFAGAEGLTRLAELDDVNTVVAAVVGVAGLPAVLAAVRGGKRVAIANKEPLVVAGKMITAEAKKYGAEILPVDSEHSAIFQALQAGRRQEVTRIVLTTSGGPFRGATAEDIENATTKEVMAHPVWRMGPKITVDSATMMNKALEIIEARWLFDIGQEKIEVLVHPESIVHSLVEFVDGSVMAQMGSPDMTLAIQYALTYPRRLPGCAKKLQLDRLKVLTFEKPNLEIFPAIKMGFDEGVGPEEDYWLSVHVRITVKGADAYSAFCRMWHKFVPTQREHSGAYGVEVWPMDHFGAGPSTLKEAASQISGPLMNDLPRSKE